MKGLARAALLAVALAASAQAQAPATNANEEAKQLAQRLGRERSAEGLETIVASRNRELLESYERGWRETSEKQRGEPCPPAIEAIMIKNYHDPIVGARLRALVSANWTPYRTRELFDLMLAEWRTGKERPTSYPIREGIFRTSLQGIEPPVLAWLAETPGPGENDANAIMIFLSNRKYAPAVPVLAKRLAEKGAGDGMSIAEWIFGFGSREAASVLIDRIAWLRDRSGGVEERLFIANRLATLPEGTLDVGALRAALGPGTVEDPRYREVSRLLADPAAFYAQRAAFAKAQEEGRKRSEQQQEGMRQLHEGNVARFRDRDPRRALELYAGAERAGQPLAIFLQGDTWQFDLRDKARAIAEYRRNLDKLAAIPDTQRGDERAFLEWAKRWLRYQIAFLESGRTFSGAIGRDDVAGAGLLIYLGAGVGVDDDDIGRIGPPDIVRKLSALPPSGWILLRTAGHLAMMPDARSVLDYLARHDPAGYASACIFGLVDMAQREGARGGLLNRSDRLGFADSRALHQARDRFARERRVTFTPLPPRP